MEVQQSGDEVADVVRVGPHVLGADQDECMVHLLHLCAVSTKHDLIRMGAKVMREVGNTAVLNVETLVEREERVVHGDRHDVVAVFRDRRRRLLRRGIWSAPETPRKYQIHSQNQLLLLSSLVTIHLF